MNVPQVLSEQTLMKLPVRERQHYIKETIRKTIHENQDGVTVQMLAERLPFDRRTIAKHLSVMRYTNELYTRTLGNTIVYLPNSRLIHPQFESTFALTDKELKVSLIKNRLGEFVFIQERKKDKYREDIGAAIVIPKPAFQDFVRFLRDLSNKLE
jgi:hypothetical protein